MKFVDLSPFYNHLLHEEIHHKPGNDLSFISKGLHKVDGINFYLQGIIQLSGSISKEKTGNDYPSEILGIKINHKAKRIHFLQCSSWHENLGTMIGEYVIHYTNKIAKIPIVYGEHVVDWWFLPKDELPTNAVIAFKGDNERTKNLGYSIQLYEFSWNNSSPEDKIETIDFVSCGKESAPFLMAVTVE